MQRNTFLINAESDRLQNGGPVPVSELRLAAWYRAPYTRRTDKTKQRDLSLLHAQGLLKQDKKGRL